LQAKERIDFTHIVLMFNVSTGLHRQTSLMNLVLQLILKLNVDFARHSFP